MCRVQTRALHPPGKDHAGHAFAVQMVKKGHKPLNAEYEIRHQPVRQKAIQRGDKRMVQSCGNHGGKPPAPGNDGNAA